MSRLTDLIAKAKAKDAQLGIDLEREFKLLSSRLSFGLNFERHQPEAVELPMSYPRFSGHQRVEEELEDRDLTAVILHHVNLHKKLPDGLRSTAEHCIEEGLVSVTHETATLTEKGEKELDRIVALEEANAEPQRPRPQKAEQEKNGSLLPYYLQRDLNATGTYHIYARDRSGLMCKGSRGEAEAMCAGLSLLDQKTQQELSDICAAVEKLAKGTDQPDLAHRLRALVLKE